MTAGIKDAKFAYVTRCQCGHADGIAADIPACAKDIAKWLRQGRSPERVTIEEGRRLAKEMCFGQCAEKSALGASEGDNDGN